MFVSSENSVNSVNFANVRENIAFRFLMFKIQTMTADLFRYFYNKVRGKRGNRTKARAMGRGGGGEGGIEEDRDQCEC